jgi:hypothetical protein
MARPLAASLSDNAQPLQAGFNARTAPIGQCAVRPAGTFFPQGDFAFGLPRERQLRERNMHGLIYLIGLIVVILFILSLFGLR